MSATHLVLIPSFNTGPVLAGTVSAARAAWPSVWLVSDGSTDRPEDTLRRATLPGQVRHLRMPANGGKGAAVLHGTRAALAAGFTHVLVMDADGQHHPGDIARFMDVSRARPQAVVAGQPRFGPDAPLVRVLGRRVSNLLTAMEAAPVRTGDGLFGLRVYPAGALCRAMAQTRFMRGFDFDPEALVRLAWLGCPVVRIGTPVRYLAPAQGGVSHFRYGRDNARLASMHARLLATAAVRRLFTLVR